MRSVTAATCQGLAFGAVIVAVILTMPSGDLGLAGAQPSVVTVPLTSSPEQPEGRVDIDASPQQVWMVLTDFPAYPIWNPFIYPVSGIPRPDSPLEMTLHPESGPVTYRATVVTAQPNRELSWTGQILSAGVYAVTFIFTIEPLTGGGARLEARERGKGVAPVSWGVGGDIPRGLDQMAKALRNRAELLRVAPHPLPTISTPRP
jgi:hypothetical protein